MNNEYILCTLLVSHSIKAPPRTINFGITRAVTSWGADPDPVFLNKVGSGFKDNVGSGF